MAMERGRGSMGSDRGQYIGKGTAQRSSLVTVELECTKCDFTDTKVIPEVLHRFLSIDHVKETGHPVDAKFYRDGEYVSGGIYSKREPDSEPEPEPEKKGFWASIKAFILGD